MVIQRYLKKYRDGEHFGAERKVRQPWAVVVKKSFWAEATYRGLERCMHLSRNSERRSCLKLKQM